MNKLWVRLSLAFTGMVLVAVLIVVTTSLVLEQADDPHSFTTRFLQQPGGLVEQLANYYQAHQSWAGVEPMLQAAQAVYRRPEMAFSLADSQDNVFYHVQPEKVGQPLSQTNPALILPIQVDQQTVGYLGLAPLPEATILDRRRSAFEKILVDALLSIAAVGGLSGIVFGVVMSRYLTAPLRKLAEAAKAIGARNLSQRVEEKGSDEVIAVSRAFNEMAADLEQAEQLRRNLLADVAHELRTPLAVLQANLRAILDEVYPLDQTEIANLYEHTRFLNRLVNDLHELAQAEARQLPLDLQNTDLTQLVRTTVESFRPGAEEKGVTLNTNLPPNSVSLQVDQARLNQVLQNLLANALRHTPAGGQITIGLETKPETLHLAVSDTGDGIPTEHLPHVFDRFYRTDPARSRDRGGAGLGLAIARAIVEAHGGQIKATSQGTPGQGSTFTIQLPPPHAL